MGWKLVIAGAASLAFGAFFLFGGMSSGDSAALWFGFAFLLIGILSTPLGLMIHSDRRFRELARELDRLRAELMRRREAAKDETTEDEPE